MRGSSAPLNLAHQVGTGDFLDGIFLVGLGVDGTIIADGVDLFTVPSNLGHCVTLGLLELLNELVHDIDEDNLQDERFSGHALSILLGGGVVQYLKAGLTQLLADEATTNIPTSKVNSFESHLEEQDSCFVIGERTVCVARNGVTCRLRVGGRKSK